MPDKAWDSGVPPALEAWGCLPGSILLSVLSIL